MDTLEILEEKINKAIKLIEKLTIENESLAGENEHLKAKLNEYATQMANSEKTDKDKSEKIKSKLNNLLDKLGTLEQI